MPSLRSSYVLAFEKIYKHKPNFVADGIGAEG